MMKYIFIACLISCTSLMAIDTTSCVEDTSFPGAASTHHVVNPSQYLINFHSSGRLPNPDSIQLWYSQSDCQGELVGFKARQVFSSAPTREFTYNGSHLVYRRISTHVTQSQSDIQYSHGGQVISMHDQATITLNEDTPTTGLFEYTKTGPLSWLRYGGTERSLSYLCEITETPSSFSSSSCNIQILNFVDSRPEAYIYLAKIPAIEAESRETAHVTVPVYNNSYKHVMYLRTNGLDFSFYDLNMEPL